MWLTDPLWTTELGGCRHKWRGRPHSSPELKSCVGAYAKKKTWLMNSGLMKLVWRGGGGGGGGGGGAALPSR